MLKNSNLKIDTFLYEIEHYPLFKHQSRSEILSLLENGRMRASKHKEILYHLGDEAHSFGLVLRGAYKLVRPTPRSDETIMYFSSPGDVIAALIMPHPKSVYPVSAIAMGPSLVWDIPKATFIKTWEKNPSIVLSVQNLLYSRMVQLQDEKILNRSPNNQKIAHLLLQLMEKYSLENEGMLSIPITRREIADSIGSTVESVIRIMSDWSHRGIIATSDQHIEIIQLDKVVELLKEG